jgi:hypothetical protein
VGTYKGTIEVFRGPQTQEYFNAIVNVTKVNDKTLLRTKTKKMKSYFILKELSSRRLQS